MEQEAERLRIAVVTGGSRGIGRAIAHRLAKDGRSVVVTGRDEDRLRETAAELSNSTGVAVSYEVADVRDPSAVERLFESVDSAAAESGGKLDVVVANAGVGLFKPCAEMTPAEFRDVLETNLFGVFLTCRAAIPRLLRNGGGDIVTIGSLAGRNAFAGGTAYNASKFGLNGFSEALFQEVRQEGIRVSQVQPGSVDTDFHSQDDASWMSSPDEIAEAVADVLALPRRSHISRLEIRPAKPRARR